MNSFKEVQKIVNHWKHSCLLNERIYDSVVPVQRKMSLCLCVWQKIHRALNMTYEDVKRKQAEKEKRFDFKLIEITSFGFFPVKV